MVWNRLIKLTLDHIESQSLDFQRLSEKVIQVPFWGVQCIAFSTGVEEGIREGIADLFWGVVHKSGGWGGRWRQDASSNEKK